MLSTHKAICLALGVLSTSATVAVQSAFAQVPPILPTDVTGPTSGGVGPSGVLRNLGVNDTMLDQSSSMQQFQNSAIYPRQQGLRMMTYPTVMPRSLYQYGGSNAMPYYLLFR